MSTVINEVYANRYKNFIKSRKQRVLPSGIYIEKHHIVPKSLGGSNKKSNLIPLSKREHYIAHLLLWQTYKGVMARAFHFISNLQNKNKRLTSRQYAQLKKELHWSEEAKKRMSQTKKGQKNSLEHNENIRLAKLGKKNPMYGKTGKDSHSYGKGLSEETKEKISKALTGRTFSEETKDKMSKTRKGMIMKESQLANLNKGRIKKFYVSN